MNVFNDDDFARFPKTDGYQIVCPSGDYSRVKNIPWCCWFKNPVCFGNGVTVGRACTFSSSAVFGNYAVVESNALFLGGVRFGNHCRVYYCHSLSKVSFGSQCSIHGGSVERSGCGRIREDTRIDSSEACYVRLGNGELTILNSGFPATSGRMGYPVCLRTRAGIQAFYRGKLIPLSHFVRRTIDMFTGPSGPAYREDIDESKIEKLNGCLDLRPAEKRTKRKAYESVQC